MHVVTLSTINWDWKEFNKSICFYEFCNEIEYKCTYPFYPFFKLFPLLFVQKWAGKFFRAILIGFSSISCMSSVINFKSFKVKRIQHIIIKICATDKMCSTLRDGTFWSEPNPAYCHLKYLIRFLICNQILFYICWILIN